MTLNRWFVVLASTVGLAACSDANGPLEADQLHGRWAGSSWVGSASAYILKGGPEGDTLIFGATGPISRLSWWEFTRTSYPVDWITATIVFHGTGVYQLGPGAARYETTGPADGALELYSTRLPVSGTLVVTRYEGIGNKIEGTIAFDAVSSSQFKPFGDNPSLQDGRFRATVHVPPTLEQ